MGETQCAEYQEPRQDGNSSFLQTFFLICNTGVKLDQWYLVFHGLRSPDRASAHTSEMQALGTHWCRAQQFLKTPQVILTHSWVWDTLD